MKALPAPAVILCGMFIVLQVYAGPVTAHNVAGQDQGFLISNTGVSFFPFMYLGAKHMVTGYDHLLFLLGVIFFLYRLRDVVIYVTLFAVGHSITLLYGVLADVQVNSYLVDAVIGLSVVYKAFENLDGFRVFFTFQPDTRIAVLIFGLFHGFGLATKLQEIQLSGEGLVVNMLAFNLGVEAGQILALSAILLVLNIWRLHSNFIGQAWFANLVLISAGFALFGFQLTGYFMT